MKKLELLKNDKRQLALRSELEEQLQRSESEESIQGIISKVNLSLKNQEISKEIKLDLRNFRQKAYERKKKIKTFQIQNENRFDFHPVKIKNHKFGQDMISKYFKNLHLDFCIKKGFHFIFFLICSLLTLFFVWKQSVPLYGSTGFQDPKFCAFGAIFMIIGFSAIHTLTRSKIALLLCFYVSTYEVILIVKGTMRSESETMMHSFSKNSEIVWLKEKVTHSNQTYQFVKTQFENPSSKVFQNHWYQKRFVEPAWNEYSKSNQKLSEKMNQLKTGSSDWERLGLLKILYRLGLIFLSMISIHHLAQFFSRKEYNCFRSES